MDLEKELSKVVFTDETFVNKAAVGNKIIEYIRRSRRARWRRIWFAAASIAAVVLVATGYFASSVDIRTGQSILAVSLPDGSAVQMQEQSRVTYNRIGWLWNRDVTLDGQARFTVVKGSRFTVRTDFGAVTVRGTEFTVTTGLQTLTVECFSGSVEVATPVGNRVLEAGDKVDCSPAGMEFTAVKPPLPPYIRYSHAALSEVVSRIEQIYGVTVAPTDACAGITYDGVLPTGNLDEALDVVMSSCGIRYQITGNQVNISFYEQ